DANAFAEWLNKTHPEAGLFRLPTWNEWMVAAYGKARSYPWGNRWDPARAHTSYGIKDDLASDLADEDQKPRPVRTEPVKARPRGRTPEGLFSMYGNASEYIIDDDPTAGEYFNLGSRWMGGGFTDGRAIV